jgi:hypothetical protein
MKRSPWLKDKMKISKNQRNSSLEDFILFFLGPPAWVFIHFYLGNRERRAREYARKQGWLYERSVLEVILEHMLNSLFIIFGIVFCLLFTLPYLSIVEGWKFAKDLCKDVPPSVRTPCAITLYVFLLPLFPLYLLLIFFFVRLLAWFPT